MNKYSRFCEYQTGMERGSLPSTGPRQTHPVGASDTHAGKRNTKMAAACSVCLHAAMCDVGTADPKGHPK